MKLNATVVSLFSVLMLQINSVTLISVCFDSGERVSNTGACDRCHRLTFQGVMTPYYSVGLVCHAKILVKVLDCRLCTR